MLIDKEKLRVKDVISYALYVPGGIHPPKPIERKKQHALSAAAADVSFTHYPAGRSALLAIGRVVLKGLAPLRAEVVARVD
jgi:hypothetical protein